MVPRFASGSPHYGHILAGVIKDIVPRYWTMRGHRIERRFGWDTHGLPVEMEVEKELGVSGPKAIEAYGVALFNEACRAKVERTTEDWQRITRRMGRWVDFENDYKTMDPDFMESGWWVFSAVMGEGPDLSGLQSSSLFVGRGHSPFQLRSEHGLPGRRRSGDHRPLACVGESRARSRRGLFPDLDHNPLDPPRKPGHRGRRSHRVRGGQSRRPALLDRRAAGRQVLDRRTRGRRSSHWCRIAWAPSTNLRSRTSPKNATGEPSG